MATVSLIPEKLFYLQDARHLVGNAVIWWAKDYGGYTCDLRKAHVFKETELAGFDLRSTDVPWPKEFVDTNQMPILDIQTKTGLEQWKLKELGSAHSQWLTPPSDGSHDPKP